MLQDSFADIASVFAHYTYICLSLLYTVERPQTLVQAREEAIQIRKVWQRAPTRRLKQLQLTKQVVWTIVERSCGDENDSLTSADAVEFCVRLVIFITKSMS